MKIYLVAFIVCLIIFLINLSQLIRLKTAWVSIVIASCESIVSIGLVVPLMYVLIFLFTLLPDSLLTQYLPTGDAGLGLALIGGFIISQFITVVFNYFYCMKSKPKDTEAGTPGEP